MTALQGIKPGALEGIRVIEVASLYTQYSGKMLAELGAEVILVEPPRGSVNRAVPPFIDQQPGLDNSLAYIQGAPTRVMTAPYSLEAKQGKVQNVPRA